jgi:subtilisin-like proprotein convertase family protein
MPYFVFCYFLANLLPVYTVREPVRGHTFKIVTMQPNFTLMNSRLSLFRLFLILGFLQLGIFQTVAQSLERNNDSKRPAPTAQQIEQKVLLSQRSPANTLPLTQNDVGSVTYGDALDQPRTEAICSVYTGTLSSTDPSLTSGRLNRNGVASSCATPKVCPGNFAAGTTFYYQTHTFTNPLNVSQCLTVTHQNTGSAGLPHLSIHNGPFNPANICTNYLADYGSSPAVGASVTFTFTIPANATITLVVTTTAANTFGAYSITLDGCQPLCSGTPAPGNTISSANPVCAGVNFTLSLQNATTGAGVTYQWQSATSAAGPWTNITGATNSTATVNQLAATFYRCQVTCQGTSTGTSNPLQVTMNPPLSCYCLPPPSNCTDNDVITRVRLSTLDNSSGCSAGPPPGYTSYTGTVAAPIVFSGAANPITVNTPTIWSENVSVWIDYNVNGQFEANEYTNIGSNAGNGGVITNNINIPATALTGVTRMRVRVRFGTTALTSAQACSAFTFGETEDYNVNIQPCVPGSFTSQPASTSVTCGGNATFSVAAVGSLLTYTWQYRTSATGTWIDITNGGVFGGATTSTLTLTNVPGSFNGYQFRALMRGGCTAVDFSNAGTLTVNPIVPVVNPASATICTGTTQTLTLTNSVSAPTTGIFVASAGLPLAIPDNTPVGTTASVAVSGIPAGVLVTNVAVKFTMTHTWVGDMIMNLRAPNGQVLNLIGLLNNGQGLNSTANFTNTVVDSLSTTPMSGAPAPRTGTYRADRYGVGTNLNPIATTTSFWAPLLTTLNGNWTLGLSDLGPGDFGNLISWEIQISYVAPVFAQGTWTASPATPNTMFTDAAATIAYTGAPATTIYVKPTVNTSYSVSFTTPTPCQSAVTTIPVNVTNPVVGLAVAPATRAVCLGGSTTFNATVTSGGPITYQWERSIDGGLTYSAITGATSATLTISGVTQNMTGYRYRVVATAAPCGSVTSNVATLTVNALPVVTISAPVVRLVPGRTTTITATSTPPAAPNGWSWTYNGGAIPGTTNTQVVNIDQLGSYQATVVDVNGCTNKSNSLIISAEATDKLWIYPNPTVNGAFQVRLYFGGDLAEKRVVTIYNPLGQVIESREFTLVRGTAPYQRMDFNLGGGATAKGAYVVKVAHQYTGKVISGIILVQ